ncbi:dTDP-4-dehydrorhamnose reductase [Chryseobacterium sp. H1D6B]|uniref:dTDP-4-dehydrorhamnose reductase family protein n=1 Tax=Chryseobacterium sp. H1D6B TaxID=2940588 RepID=UPI00180C6D0D|nr:SDR family oxidoreductase [Chryseobacterium sp. H1D6B]MDH6250685.1 dTDP-4-dehydrorhamnose reductase [Chryseobacterium sp. H1D6B]
MKNIIVLGASGMAGHVVYTYLKEKLDSQKYRVLGTTNNNNFSDVSQKLNIFDTNEVEKYLVDVKPYMVINCIGMLIKGSKEFPDKTIFANSYFPHFLARLASENSFKLVHISTDCVFSGKKGGYTENSPKDASDIYGMSKALGEIVDSKNLTIRTSIIGPEIKQNGEGLFDWFMKSEESNISGYKSNFWSGITTLELAKFLTWLVSNDNLNELVHLTNNEAVSKYSLLTLFNEVYAKNKTINDDRDYICDKSFINTNKQLTYQVPSYKEMLEEQKEFMKNHSDLYKHYNVNV